MIKEIENVIKAIDAAYGAINDLMLADACADEDPIKVSQRLDLAKGVAADMQRKVSDIVEQIYRERDFAYRLGERFYVYTSEQYGKKNEASLTALGKVSSTSWHDLQYAASHWKRMNEAGAKQARGGVLKYSIMSYDPKTGSLRKVAKAEIDAALEKAKKEEKS